MRVLTPDGASEWCRGIVSLDKDGRPLLPSADSFHAHIGLPDGHAELTWFCQHLERSLQPREECLLWVTASGIWRSSENLHLYYRLRQSYDDHRLLHEAPAHLFLDYESADLVSFIEVAVLCGWDFHLIPAVGYARAFVSHDEFVEFSSSEGRDAVEAFRKPLDDRRDCGSQRQ